MNETPEEIKLGTLLRFKPKGCKGRLDHAGPFLYDEKSPHVECETCGMTLTALYVLKNIQRWYDRVKSRAAELIKIGQEAEKRNRTKCQHCSQFTRIIKP